MCWGYVGARGGAGTPELWLTPVIPRPSGRMSQTQVTAWLATHSGEEVKWKVLSRVPVFGTPWTAQSMGFSRPEYWSGQPFPLPGGLPNPGSKPRSPTLQEDSLPAEPPGRPTHPRETPHKHLCCNQDGNLVCTVVCMFSHSVLSDSLQTHGL